MPTIFDLLCVTTCRTPPRSTTIGDEYAGESPSQVHLTSPVEESNAVSAPVLSRLRGQSEGHHRGRATWLFRSRVRLLCIVAQNPCASEACRSRNRMTTKFR